MNLSGPNANGVKTGIRTRAGYLKASLMKSFRPAALLRVTIDSKICGKNDMAIKTNFELTSLSS